MSWADVALLLALAAALELAGRLMPRPDPCAACFWPYPGCEGGCGAKRRYLRHRNRGRIARRKS